jgi:NAD+ synthase (glutamine-hydrolysing)
MNDVTNAVILAAGRGTRMRELTREIPKPMVKVHDKPVLEHIVEGLRSAGVLRILIVVGYRKEVIQTYFGDGSRWGISISYIEQVVQDGTGKVVQLAQDFCAGSPFLLVYGDILVDPVYYRLLADLRDAEMLIAVRHTDDVSKGGAVYLNDQFEVVDLQEKQSPTASSTNWYNAGIYTFKPSVFSYIAKIQRSPRGEYELTDAIRDMAQDGQKIRALEIKGNWADVRDPEILAELNRKGQPQTPRIGFAQINTTVGDLRRNQQRILSAYETAVQKGAQLVLTPELALTGYPPQDLVFKSRFVPSTLEILEELHEAIGSVPLLVGYVDFNRGATGKPFVNACAVLAKGRPIQKVFKTLLPTYDVFDEARYFEPASDQATIELLGKSIGITICEDIWTDKYLKRGFYHQDPVKTLVAKGAQMILNLSSSPYHAGKPALRRAMVSELALQYGVAFYYCNAIGGNDELVFDGNSFAIDAAGKTVFQMSGFKEEVAVTSPANKPIPVLDLVEEEEIFNALVLGVRDYFEKCGFKSAVLGLSGGIDSAVTAVIATAALGKRNVVGVSMPSQYSSQGSLDDAAQLANNLGIVRHVMPIKDAFGVFKDQFKEVFAGLKEDTTEENMQSRLRGLILMSFSNKFGHLLLTTGNKSELAVGYCTIYGDMCGGLAVISDVPKTMIYDLAKWINREQEIIPENSVTKPPSAELKPGQKDQDTLPSYEVLDEVLRLYVEEQFSPEEIVQRGFAPETVRWIQRRVDINEYKRRQAAPGLKVTSLAFGMGWRMPIAQRYMN